MQFQNTLVIIAVTFSRGLCDCQREGGEECETASALQTALHNALPVWSPEAQGWTGYVKPFWFGANPNGATSHATLELMSKHAVAGYGWQQGGQPAVGKGEERLSEAMTKVRSYMDSMHNDKTMMFVYRQIQVVLRLFGSEAKLADDPSLRQLWLHDPTADDPSQAATCLADQPWGTQDPYWNFSNPDAVTHWLDSVISDLAHDPAMQGGRAAVFFDEVDQSTCGYRAGTCDFSRFNSSLMHLDNIKMQGKMVKRLNDAGIIPILSIDNRIRDSHKMLSGLEEPCAQPEDRLLEELEGLMWVRFYEGWPHSPWEANSADLRAAMVENTILEAKRGIRVALHASWWSAANGPTGGWGTCPVPSRKIVRPGRLGGDLEFIVAAYLIVQAPSLGTTLSLSNNWYDGDFCWHPEWDVDFGAPLGEATRISAYSWTRNYTKATVFVDVSSYSGEVHLLCDPMPCPPALLGWHELHPMPWTGYTNQDGTIEPNAFENHLSPMPWTRLNQAMHSTSNVSGPTIEEFKAALDEHKTEHNPEQAQENADGQSRGWPWSPSETCCMCSIELPHLGSLLYAAEDYDHDHGSHDAHWECQQSCRQQCRWRGHGDFFGCYDENHIRQMNNRYEHRHGWSIWQERRGHIC